MRASDPQYVIMSHTYLVRDFAPKVAARFGKGLIGDCIRMNVDAGKATFTRRIFLGKLDADVVSDGGAPTFVTFQSGAFRGDQAVKGSGGQVETMDVDPGEVRMRPEAPFQEAKQAVDLTKANIIVAIGRGIKSKDNIALAEKLAEVLGADLAASRPICDAEWLPIDRQIGSSGQTVAPKLYIAVGISGAIQHLVGIFGTNCRAKAVHRRRYFRSDSTSGRHEELRDDRRYQQRSGSANLRRCGLRHRGRFV